VRDVDALKISIKHDIDMGSAIAIATDRARISELARRAADQVREDSGTYQEEERARLVLIDTEPLGAFMHVFPRANAIDIGAERDHIVELSRADASGAPGVYYDFF
jgi:hypothetical protein